ncbi:Zinc finger protein 862 [Acipenser ruthenus]|uniref:Zinc finger protein 862 n=1 Tax=Acipenser ruthenus TaxID=7906 RepID=A0A444UC22_ACIRT|nr:Zinc finger protein 862 [Acipenser ruthenus]
MQSFKHYMSLDRVAFLAALQGMYWLTTTKFASLLDMMQGLGLSYLSHLNKGGNANYTSEKITWEMVKVLSDVPRHHILHTLHSSPYFSILVDEMTDVAEAKQLIIFGCYLTDCNEVKTSILGIRDILIGTADTITQAIKVFLTDMDVDIRKMARFGSDGASVMVGQINGVAAQLRAANSKLVSVHCIAHRLALAGAQAATGIPYLLKFKDLLGQLYRF